MDQHEVKFSTIPKFSKKYNIPTHLVRVMCKNNRLPGFFIGNRFYLNETLAIQELHDLSVEGKA